MQGGVYGKQDGKIYVAGPESGWYNPWEYDDRPTDGIKGCKIWRLSPRGRVFGHKEDLQSRKIGGCRPGDVSLLCPNRTWNALPPVVKNYIRNLPFKLLQ